MRRPLRFVLALLVLASTFTVVGCQQPSPEEKVMQKRSHYTVELNSWFVKKPPAPTMEEMSEESAEEVAEEVQEEQIEETTPIDEAVIVDGEDTEARPSEDMAPATRTIFFDLIVLYDGRDEPLPGITVEVSHVDAGGNEKSSTLQFLEIADIVKGSTKQVSFELDGVEYEEGDQFAVTLESNVPPEKRDQYREFAAAGE